MVRAADLVLVMERGHLAAVRALGADAGHSHVLSEWPAPGEPGLEISDPFGASIEALRGVLAPHPSTTSSGCVPHMRRRRARARPERALRIVPLKRGG